MDCKLPAQPSLINVVNWKPYMNRKLIHWATLQQQSLTCYDATKNSCCIFSRHSHITSAAILNMSESRELHMAGCIIKRKVEWSSPEVHRTLCEEVINVFLKVCDSMSSYFVTGCFHEEFWQYTFAKGKNPRYCFIPYYITNTMVQIA